MKRSLVAVVAAAALLVGAPTAVADARRVADAEERESNVDLKWAAHGHGDAHRIVRHGIGTHRRWRDRGLRGQRIRIELNTNKSHAYERSVRIQYRDGRLRAAMYKGDFMDVKVPGRVRLWRPTKRSLWVSFDADMLRDGIRSYRWSVSVYTQATCPGSCPFDEAPESGWVRHRL